MKGYKVRDVTRTTRAGIAAENFDEVIQKGKEKLQILDRTNVTLVLEDDGTIVDSHYFQTLPSQTSFVLLREGETWNGAEELVSKILNIDNEKNRKLSIAKEIHEMLTGEIDPERIAIMTQCLQMVVTNIEAENRQEHEDWFEGVDQKYQTKGAFMNSIAQQRIRSYFNSAKDQVQKVKEPHIKSELLTLLKELHAKLTVNTFHGHYFDRSSSSRLRICDEKGWFKCEGAFDVDKCLHSHNINPYASKDFKHLFALWNLDHVIEKSRVVIPTLIQAARKKPKSKKLNATEVYRLLFTRENLKLVDIACHKKAARSSNYHYKKFIC